MPNENAKTISTYNSEQLIREHVSMSPTNSRHQIKQHCTQAYSGKLSNRTRNYICFYKMKAQNAHIYNTKQILGTMQLLGQPEFRPNK